MYSNRQKVRKKFNVFHNDTNKGHGEKKKTFSEFYCILFGPNGNHLLKKNCPLPLSSQDQVFFFFKEISPF